MLYWLLKYFEMTNLLSFSSPHFTAKPPKLKSEKSVLLWQFCNLRCTINSIMYISTTKLIISCFKIENLVPTNLIPPNHNDDTAEARLNRGVIGFQLIWKLIAISLGFWKPVPLLNPRTPPSILTAEHIKHKIGETCLFRSLLCSHLHRCLGLLLLKLKFSIL